MADEKNKQGTEKMKEISAVPMDKWHPDQQTYAPKLDDGKPVMLLGGNRAERNMPAWNPGKNYWVCPITGMRMSNSI